VSVQPTDSDDPECLADLPLDPSHVARRFALRQIAANPRISPSPHVPSSSNAATMWWTASGFAARGLDPVTQLADENPDAGNVNRPAGNDGERPG
jgi:hypothetical protein